MKKRMKFLGYLLLLVCLVYVGSLVADRQKLHNELIRLHVVAASDTASDQQIKLSVRDAVLESLEEALEDVRDVEQAKEYIREHLPQLEAVANQVLTELGVDAKAVVSFMEEKFPSRVYDTFSLPSGVYESLRITIGEGKGQNWWCVVFPTLCTQATVSGVQEAAVEAGFSDALTSTVVREEGYQVRFFLLDMLGKLENIFSR